MLKKRYSIHDDDKKWDRSLRKRFGITLNQLKALCISQNGVCWICENEDITGTNLAIDHDHVDGYIRGLLCRECNRALGQFKDDINNLKKAIKYLEKGPAQLIEYDEYVYTPHQARPRWRCIVETPDGTFSSYEAAGQYYGVHSTTIREWCGYTKRTHLKKKDWKSTKVFK